MNISCYILLDGNDIEPKLLYALVESKFAELTGELLADVLTHPVWFLLGLVEALDVKFSGDRSFFNICDFNALEDQDDAFYYLNHTWLSKLLCVALIYINSDGESSASSFEIYSKRLASPAFQQVHFYDNTLYPYAVHILIIPTPLLYPYTVPLYPTPILNPCIQPLYYTPIPYPYIHPNRYTLPVLAGYNYTPLPYPCNYPYTLPL